MRQQPNTSSDVSRQEHTPVPLVPHVQFTREVRGGEAHSYLLRLDAGQFMSVRADQHGVDIVLSLHDPNGMVLAEIDGPSGTRGFEELSFVAESAGTYVLNVRPFEGGTGSYDIVLAELRPAVPSDRKRVAAEALYAEAAATLSRPGATRFNEVLGRLKATLPLWREAGVWSREAETLILIGSLYHSMNDLARSAESFEAALLIYRKIGDRGDEARTLAALGLLSYKAKDLTKSVEYYEQALDIWRKSDDAESVARLSYELANLLFSVEQYDRATTYYEVALSFAARRGDKREARHLLNSLGLCYARRNLHARAIALYGESLKIAREIKDSKAEAVTLSYLALSYSELDNYAQAATLYESALVIVREMKDWESEYALLVNLGRVYESANDRDKAVNYLEQAASVKSPPDEPRHPSEALESLWPLYSQKQEYAKAIDALRRLLDVPGGVRLERRTGVLISNLGSMHEKSGEFGVAAEKYALSATVLLEAGASEDAEKVIENLAHVEARLGRHNQAVETYERLLNIARRRQDRGAQAALLSEIGYAYDAQAVYGKAAEYLSQAAALARELDETGGGAATRDADAPKLLTQLGHSGYVLAASFSPDGRLALTGGADNTARLWHVASGRELRKFEEAMTVNAVAFSPDGRYVLTGVGSWKGYGSIRYVSSRVGAYVHSSADRPVRKTHNAAHLWEVASGREVRLLLGHTAMVNAVAFSPDGSYVLTGSADTTARLWATASGATVRVLWGHRAAVKAVAFSTDGKLALTGGEDGLAILWDLTSGRVLRRLEHASHVLRVAFGADSKTLLTLSVAEHLAPDASLREEARVILQSWDASTGQKLEGAVSGAADAFSPDGKMVLLRRADDEADLLLAEGRQKLWELRGKGAGSDPLVFSPDGRTVLTGGGNTAIHLWEIGTRVPRQLGNSAVSFWSLALSRDGKTLALGGIDGLTSIWDMETSSISRTVKVKVNDGDGTGPTRGVDSISFSPDGRFMIARSIDGMEPTASILDVTTGAVLRDPNGVTASDKAAIYTPDGRSLLVADGSDKSVVLKDASTLRELRRFKTGGDSTPRLGPVSPDGRAVLMLGSGACLMSLDTGENIWCASFRLHDETTAAFSPDGRFIVTESSRFDERDEAAHLLDAATGKEITQYTGHTDIVSSVAFSPDGRSVLTAGNDGTARLWERDTGRELQRFVGHEAGLDVAAFDPRGRFVVTTGDDATVRFWSVDTGREICRLIVFDDGTWVVADDKGHFDTNNLDEIHGLHWVMADDPTSALSPEVFMRDYYEPRLLTRILTNDYFKPARALKDLNRVQPLVGIKSVERQAGADDEVSVTVEVAAARGEFLTGSGRVTRETGVYDVRLFRDGQIVGQAPAQQAGEATPPRPNEREQLARWRQASRVTLDGTGRQIIKFEHIKLPRRADVKTVSFAAYAFNEDRVKSATARTSFDVPPEVKPARGRAYLVTVGVNAYENPDWNLSFAADDARLMQRVLSEKLAQTGDYEDVVSVSLISDYSPETGAVRERSATKSNFKAILDILAGRGLSQGVATGVPGMDKVRRARPEDVIFISFSSHGLADAAGNFYFLPYDIGKGKGRGVTDELLSRSISSEELSRWLKDVDAGDIVFIVDACHSAAAVATDEFKPGPMGSSGLGQLAYDKGMRILAAGQAEDVALESNKLKQGLLTYALVHDGIEARQADRRPKDGTITLGEWLSYGVERVPSLNEEVETGRLQNFQTASDRAGGEFTVRRRGHSTERPTFLQKPALFDFARRRRELRLVR